MITPEVVIALSMYALCTPQKFNEIAFETQMEKQRQEKKKKRLSIFTEAM